MAKGTKEIVNVALQEAQLYLWREETVEVSFYLARKHETQIKVVNVVYRNVPLVYVYVHVHVTVARYIVQIKKSLFGPPSLWCRGCAILCCRVRAHKILAVGRAKFPYFFE